MKMGEDTKKIKNVVIIGGGPAGLTAGYELLKDNDDIKVTILEESKSLGGISQTVRYHGSRMDIGGLGSTACQRSFYPCDN